jgi:hypothetical protein
VNRQQNLTDSNLYPGRSSELAHLPREVKWEEMRGRIHTRSKRSGCQANVICLTGLLGDGRVYGRSGCDGEGNPRDHHCGQDTARRALIVGFQRIVRSIPTHHEDEFSFAVGRHLFAHLDSAKRGNWFAPLVVQAWCGPA